MPYYVIQNIIIQQDFWDRIFGLASLIIENAKTNDIFEYERGKGLPDFWAYEMVEIPKNQIKIPGLRKKDAEALKEIILQRVKDNSIRNTNSGL